MSDPTSSFQLETFLPYQLAVASTRVSRRFEAIYKKKFGLTVPDWRVLAHLSSAEKVSIREIHRQVDMEKSRISRAATRLEGMGLVHKATDPQDRRLVELTLTTEGKTIIRKLAPLAQAYQNVLLAELGKDAPAVQRRLGNWAASTNNHTDETA